MNLSITNIERGVLAFVLSILAAGCAAESNDPRPSPPTGPAVADQAPAPPADTKTPASADASADAADAGAVPPPNPDVDASSMSSACRLACGLCALGGHLSDCATCHSAECR